MSVAQILPLASGHEVCIFQNLEQSFPEHFHEAITCGMLLKGARRFRSGHNELLLQPDEPVLLPPRCVHSCRPEDGNVSDWISLHIFQEADFSPFIARSSVLRAGMRLLANRLLRGEVPPEQEVEQLITCILKICRQRPAARAAFRVPEELQTYLETHCHEATALDEMASRTNLEKFQLLRVFRRSLGITPYRYLENLRLINARKRLQAGMKLSDCAAISGYYDQSHLNRCFKANLGVTPGAYRAATRKPC